MLNAINLNDMLNGKIAQNFLLETWAIKCKYNCLWRQIACDYLNLLNRYKRSVTKNTRICTLSYPKQYTHIHRNKNLDNNVDKYPKVDIINMVEQRVKTRTQMLSYPRPRKLFQLMQHPSFKNFHPKRQSNVSQLMQKSLKSLYSHVSCSTQLSLKPRYKTTSDRKVDEEYLKYLSLPKRDVSNKLELSEKTLKQTAKKYLKYNALLPFRTRNESSCYKSRLHQLAKSKVNKMEEPFEWKFTKAMNNYKPTENLNKLAKPKVTPSLYKETTVSQSNYKASKRILQLAEPLKIYRKKNDISPDNANEHEVKGLALKAKASKRIVELAQPKSYSNIHIRQNPYNVKKTALKYKISERLRQLATPKKLEYV